MVEGQADADDRFGAALTTGDFDGDGRDDLAIGVPGEDVGGFADAGAVNVLYGAAFPSDQIWHQDTEQNTQLVEGQADAGDRFGSALAVSDFNGNGRDDLAIGVPGEDVGSIANAGAVNVLYGTAPDGLAAAGDQIWHQDTVQGPQLVEGQADAGDSFGAALLSQTIPTPIGGLLPLPITSESNAFTVARTVPVGAQATIPSATETHPGFRWGPRRPMRALMRRTSASSTRA